MKEVQKPINSDLLLLAYLNYNSTLKMEAVLSSEISINCHSTRRRIQEEKVSAVGALRTS
jgi:hypothetical protein